MLRIHSKDGSTSHLDLTDEAQAKAWLERLRDPSVQQKITGATLVGKNATPIQCSLVRPEGFSQVFYWPELLEPDGSMKGGEKITCFADDVRVTIMLHRAQAALRVSILKTGKQRFNPVLRNGG